MSSALDRERKLSLVFCTSPGHPAWDNLALLGREFDETFIILVVDVDIPVFAEPANFSLLDFLYWDQLIYSPIFCPLFFSSSDSSLVRK